MEFGCQTPSWHPNHNIPTTSYPHCTPSSYPHSSPRTGHIWFYVDEPRQYRRVWIQRRYYHWVILRGWRNVANDLQWPSNCLRGWKVNTGSSQSYQQKRSARHRIHYLYLALTWLLTADLFLPTSKSFLSQYLYHFMFNKYL